MVVLSQCPVSILRALLNLQLSAARILDLVESLNISSLFMLLFRSIPQQLMRTLRSLLPVFHCCRSNKLCVASAMYAAVACNTSNFSLVQRTCGNAPSLVSRDIIDKRVCPLHIVACASYTYDRWIMIETHAAVEMAWISHLVYLSLLIQRKEWRIAGVSKLHLCTMNAPSKMCFNSPLSSRQTPDHRPRKGRWPDEGSWQIFLGNAASSVTIANLRPALWSSTQKAIKAKDKSSKRKECSKDSGKAKSKEQVVLSTENTASSWSKQIPIVLLRATRWGTKSNWTS